MKPTATPQEKFDGWFVKAIEKLKELPAGDGAFAALMIVLPLYERYIVATLKLEGRQAEDAAKKEVMSRDLGLNDRQRSIFWSVFRIGFTHQGMGKSGQTKWRVSHDFGELPEFQTIDNTECVCLDPWKFAQRVRQKYQDDPRLITASQSFPLADVFSF